MNNDIVEISKSSNSLLKENYEKSLNIVEDIVFNKFVKDLEKFEIVPLEYKFNQQLFDYETRMFKINKLVYSKDEDIYGKITNIINTLYLSECSVYLILDSNGTSTDVYMGIRSDDPKREVSHIMNMFENSLKGHFPGSITENLDNTRKREIIADYDNYNVAISTSVPGIKDQNLDIQRLEGFIESMRGKSYTAVILADNSVAKDIEMIRSHYEEIYTGLSYLKEVNITEGRSESETIGNTLSLGSNTSSTENTSRSSSINESESESKMNKLGKMASIIGSGVGVAVGGGIPGLAIGGGMGAGLFGGQESYSLSKNIGESQGISNTEGHSRSESKSTSNQSSSNNSMSLSVENKKIKNILDKIDLQFERLEEFENLGVWETAAYFISKDIKVAEIAASNYNSLMRGDRSGLENIAINSWYNSSEEKATEIYNYIKNFMHPKFYYEKNNEIMEVTGCSYLSGNELSICMGLPRSSIVGLPIIEHADFGKEIVKLNEFTKKDNSSFRIGCINTNGMDLKDVDVKLDENSLSQHTFITGSTGTGKSNTVYKIIEEIEKKQIKYMIIEPAKGEYKHVFKNTIVYGTNPKHSRILKINPFSFPEGIHVYEHIDRIIEIFKASWDLYSAMPAILKDALISSYESCGWDLETSESSSRIFPNFLDLERELEKSINKSGYSEEVKSNYKGALLTRVSSMTNGLNNLIFQGKELDGRELFDKNVIVDLSRVGSQETKSLIMGILIVKLNEYRVSNKKGLDEKIKHVTVIEEAHNLLPATTNDLSGANISGKSVELISNSLAEMRTYGEGFIIVDQSPSSVDISAIKNTNTKIIMRLPEENDINIAGKSIGLDESQIREIIRLPMGTAVVYQNGWLEPVLCKMDKFSIKEKALDKSPIKDKEELNNRKYIEDLIKFLICDQTNKYDFDLKYVQMGVNSNKLSSRDRIIINNMLLRYIKFKSDKLLDISGKERCDIVTNLIYNYNKNNIDSDKIYEHLDSWARKHLIDLSIEEKDVLYKNIKYSLFKA